MTPALQPAGAQPTLLAAAQLALPAMREQLDSLLEIGCEEARGGRPDRDTLDRDLEPEVRRLEAAIHATEAALSGADANAPGEAN